MDNNKLNLWKYITYMRLNMMNSYYFPLEPFYEKNLNISKDLFIKSLRSKNKWLYIHIPFCITECSYCACTKMQLKNGISTSIYVEYLIKELEIFYKLNSRKKLIFNTLTFGWWTPSILSISDIENLFSWIYKYVEKKFITQISFEAAPYTITNEKIDILKSMWVNRMSFWIQSLDKQILKNNNRPYIPKQKIKALVKYIQSLWISIEADLIVWIKSQTIKSVIEDVKFLLSMWLDDITFNYFSPHRFSKYIDNKDTINLKEKFKLIDKKLVENWQVKWSYCFQERYIYSARRYTIIGLGYGATSNLWNSFVYVKDSLQDYYDLIDKWKIPASSWIYMDDNFEYIRYIYWHIIKWEIDLIEMNRIFWVDVYNKFKKEIDFLVLEKIIEYDGKSIKNITSIDNLFIHLTVFIENIVENSMFSKSPKKLPKNIDMILKQMIYDYVI